MCVDVRGCSRGFPSHEREFSRSMSENRAKALNNAWPRSLPIPKEKVGPRRRFYREREGTRGTVLSRNAPQFPKSRKRVATFIIYSAREREI